MRLMDNPQLRTGLEIDGHHHKALLQMDEREQLEAQWASLSVAQREDLFRNWILAATNGFAPANIAVFTATGDDLVDYSFATDLSSWQVAVADSLFTNASPDQALGVGDAVIEIGHLFAEQQGEQAELEEYEQEDESVEGEQAAYAAALQAAIDELEGMQSQLEALMAGASDDDMAALQDMIDLLDLPLNALRERLKEVEDGSD
jgi:hypothetical protein